MNASTKERKVTMDQFTELVNQIQAGRITRRHVTELLKNPDRLIDWEDDAEFNIRVDYRDSMVAMSQRAELHPTVSFLKTFLSVDHMLARPTRHDGKDIKRRGPVEFDVVLRKVSMDRGVAGILEQLEEMNLDPAGPEHLMAFSGKRPEVQEKFPVIAVGITHVPSTGGSSRVPILLRNHQIGSYDTVFFADNDDIRVLAIKRSGPDRVL